MKMPSESRHILSSYVHHLTNDMFELLTGSQAYAFFPDSLSGNTLPSL